VNDLVALWESYERRAERAVHERGEMASQHVPKVLPQAVASQEALGMADCREVAPMGDLLLLLAKHKDGIHWKRDPNSKELRCGTRVLISK